MSAVGIAWLFPGIEKMQIKIFSTLLTVIMLSACSAMNRNADNCPELNIKFEKATTNRTGGRIGIFIIHNVGPGEVRIASEGAGDVLHGRFATTEERNNDSMNWRPYNTVLEELIAPRQDIVVRSGESQSVKFDANGLFIPGQSDPGMQYSIVVRSSSGCVYRSDAFKTP